MSALYIEFWQQCRGLVDTGREPRQVIFSREGYMRAMAETDKDSLARWDKSPEASSWERYNGLPFRVDARLAADIVVTDELPKPDPGSPVSFRVDTYDPRQTWMCIAGRALSRPQLCDVIDAWVRANPPSNFSSALQCAIADHGRFE